ncbi:hypothetical protein Ocin01_03409 [Orchesella cincta]|uniref:Secreted protein n=1 Tax=Orchesella cincta TaxID=48709 RepID=A0A1D2NDI7_ORCCI|nr:hypothetical protein Ocin01_03409 [Orchesella cincta]
MIVLVGLRLDFTVIFVLYSQYSNCMSAEQIQLGKKCKYITVNNISFNSLEKIATGENCVELLNNYCLWSVVCSSVQETGSNQSE